jgi:hypothetical protein
MCNLKARKLKVCIRGKIHLHNSLEVIQHNIGEIIFMVRIDMLCTNTAIIADQSYISVAFSSTCKVY